MTVYIVVSGEAYEAGHIISVHVNRDAALSAALREVKKHSGDWTFNPLGSRFVNDGGDHIAVTTWEVSP